MARTDAILDPEEIIAVEELNDVANNSMIYKDNAGSYLAIALGASGTVPTSNGATSAPTFQAGGGDTLPIVDTTAVVKGSVDATKLVRIEADGLTTGTTRVITMPDEDITLISATSTETLTNKRITERTNTITSSATPTPAGDTTDVFTVTALAAAAAFAAPTGTPTNGQVLLIRIKDDATARALTWNAIYRASTDLALPTTTIISKTLYLQFVYNSTDSKWDLLGLLNNF